VLISFTLFGIEGIGAQIGKYHCYEIAL
jgi:predicted membrane chloride channel (bestrophin family)